ncbi:DUF6320 domain-containing protein [uncultured Oscillibacter sp.]|uniref:DUF6320 domain-containing protein n=1 Tax=uncultured Oscillibacter sp. TaxID=876091 RepID=UPI0025F8E2DA|nr:DUF6320 domain-containing protein [uncultured Oscillibacter sp.]
MPYCVHCGVELDPSIHRCPLCGTAVLDPAAPAAEDGPPFFPTRPARVEPVSRRAAALLATSMLASVSVCCALLNLFLKPQYRWYLFVTGAAAMLWVWFVLPLLAKHWVPLWVRLTADVGAVAAYVALIALALDGWGWFFGLAVPVLALAAAVVCALSWLMRKGHSVLTTVTLVLAAVGIFCLGAEACGDLYFHGEWAPGWSLIVTVSCFGLCVPLLVVRRVPSLREEVRRRFHF